MYIYFLKKKKIFKKYKEKKNKKIKKNINQYNI